ncbi:MAG: DsbE family thiol:disulfide interchange protein [Steroidobacteraceae bacterium]
MTRYLLPLAAFVLLAIVLGLGVRHADKKGVVVSPLIGRAAPGFTLPDLLDPGAKFDSRSMAGRWYALNVWGTWCVECRAEHEVLVAARKAGGLPIVGLNWRDEDMEARRWLAQLGNPYEAVPVDTEGRVAIDYGVYGAPETFLIDPRGVIVHKQIGPLTMEAWQRDFLRRAAGQKQGS